MKDHQSLHAGHRRRLTERFMNCGDGALEDHELLELMLGYAIPRCNTNDTAHRLLNEFGGLYGILEADPIRLRSVEGIGRRSCEFLKLLEVFLYRAEMSRKQDLAKRPLLNELHTIGSFLCDHYRIIHTESPVAVFLDSSGRLIKLLPLAVGGKASATVDPYYLTVEAVKHDARGVVLAHNHPSGSTDPSYDDIAFTKLAESTLRAVRITLLEHIIVSGDVFRPILCTCSRSDDIGK